MDSKGPDWGLSKLYSALICISGKCFDSGLRMIRPRASDCLPGSLAWILASFPQVPFLMILIQMVLTSQWEKNLYSIFQNSCVSKVYAYP